MATAKKDAVKASYEVTSPLEHDLVRYEVGETVELTEAQAAPLLDRADPVVKPAAKA